VDATTLVDTDILIDAGRGIYEAIDYIERLEAQSTLAVSAITYMELIVGCKSKRELRALRKFLSRFDIVTLNEHISKIAVDLLLEYRLSHGLLIADALIAATAIYLNTSFVSKNQKDYRFINKLDILAYP
jgi:predicted nucleic acid-binding protein